MNRITRKIEGVSHFRGCNISVFFVVCVCKLSISQFRRPKTGVMCLTNSVFYGGQQ